MKFKTFLDIYQWMQENPSKITPLNVTDDPMSHCLHISDDKKSLDFKDTTVGVDENYAFYTLSFDEKSQVKLEFRLPVLYTPTVLKMICPIDTDIVSEKYFTDDPECEKEQRENIYNLMNAMEVQKYLKYIN